MTRLERAVIIAVVVLSMVWAGGLVVAYLSQSDEAPPVTQAAPPPSLQTIASPTTMAALPKFGFVDPLLASGVPTSAEKRKNIAAFWSNRGGQHPTNSPHARWEDRKGTILPPPPDLADADPSLSATLVSLHLDGVSCRAALTELGKQANAKFAVFPPFVWRQTSFPPITMDVDEQPLIEVVNELCCKAGLTGGWRTNRWGGGEPASTDPSVPVMPLETQSVDHSLGPWVVSGPFAFEVDQVNHLIPLNTLSTPGGELPAGELPTGAVNIQLAVQIEPKVVVLAVQAGMPTEAVDENGASLLQPVAIASAKPPPTTPTTVASARSLIATLFGRPPAIRHAPGPWQPAGNPMNFRLNYPAGAGRWIERLRCSPKFLVQARSEAITVPIAQIAAPVQQQVAGLAVEIAPLTAQNPQFVNGSIKYTRDKQTDEQWQQMRAALQSIKPLLLDAGGQPLPQPRVSFQQESDQSMTMQYTWVQQQYAQEFTPLVPVKIVVTLPSLFRVVNVPFEFDHLPFP